MSDAAGSQPSPSIPSIYSSCNGKLLLAAVICLALVVSFVLLLHIYARCFLRPRRRDPLDVEGHFSLRAARRSLRVEALPVGYLGAAVFFATASDGDGGLDAAAIASLPVFVYRKQARKEVGEAVSDQGGKKFGNWLQPDAAAAIAAPECAVCLSEMEEGEAGRELPGCGHCFHVECIDMWLTARPTCPVCRAAVKVPEEDKGPVDSAAAEQDQGNTPVVVAVAEEAAIDGITVARGREEVVVEGRRSASCAIGSDPAIQVVIEQPPPTSTTSSYSTSYASSSSSSSSSTSSSSTPTAATSLGCSLKRMLSRTRSDSRKVFPSAAAACSGADS